MYTIWRTGHEINEAVVTAFRKGSLSLSPDEPPFTIKDVSFYRPGTKPPASVSYGILRGMETIFNACKASGVEWWEMDRGYFRPRFRNNLDGYFRISLNNTRVAYNADLDLPSDRWDALKIVISPWQREKVGHILLCPPTEPVADFFGLDVAQWVDDVCMELIKHTDRPIIVRYKGDDRNYPVEYDIDGARCVVGYNSNVLIEALIKGVPAIQLQQADIYGWNGLTLSDVESDMTNFDREKLFRFLAYNQFTLQEFAKGYGWKTAQKIQKYGVLP